jgi:hypothetical protein
MVVLSGVMELRAAGSDVDTLMVRASPTSHMLQLGVGRLRAFLKAICFGSI